MVAAPPYRYTADFIREAFGDSPNVEDVITERDSHIKSLEGSEKLEVPVALFLFPSVPLRATADECYVGAIKEQNDPSVRMLLLRRVAIEAPTGHVEVVAL